MSATKPLYEKRAKIKSQMEDVLKDAREKGMDIPQDKMAQFDGWNKEFDQITEQIKSIQEAEAKLAATAEPIGKDKDKLIAKKETAEEEYKIFVDCVRGGMDTRKCTLSPERQAEIRASQFYVAGGTKGGYTIPTLTQPAIDAAQVYVGGMVQPGLCTKIQSATGATINWPNVDDTSQKGYVIAEKTDLNTSAVDMTFGYAILTFYKITSGLVKVGNELLQDSLVDFGGWLTDMLFKRVYRALNYYFTLGTGSSMPYGLRAISYKGVDGPVRTIARSDIVELMYSVNRAYLTKGTFMFNNNTMRDLRKLYMGTYIENAPLWQPSMRDGEPDRLEGRPYVVNDDVKNIFERHASVYFGDFSNYKIAEALPMKLVRLDERFADTDEVGFAILGRWAGNATKYTSHYPIKHIRHAST